LFILKVIDSIYLSAVEGDSFLRFILRQVDAIEFAFDWKKKAKRRVERSSRPISQARFMKLALAELFSASHEHSEENRKVFKTFKSDYQHIITSQNYLLDMYEQIHVIILFSPVP